MDPDPEHAKRVLQRSLEIHDGLVASGVTRNAALHQVEARELLSIAAIAHEVGRAAGRKKYHKRAARLLERLDVPPGWTADDLRTVGLVARFHRGALPLMQPSFARLARAKRHMVALLSGILRLAEAVDRNRRKGVKKIELERQNGFLSCASRDTPQPASGRNGLPPAATCWNRPAASPSR